LKDLIDSSSYLKGILDSLERNLKAFNVEDKTVKYSNEVSLSITVCNDLRTLIDTKLTEAVKSIEDPSSDEREILTLEKEYIDYLQAKID
jgi:hypothetical protein